MAPLTYPLARRAALPALIAPALIMLLAATPAMASEAPVRGADELYWTPTLEQALEMSAATGRPIFLMGYSLVGDGSTYSKLGPDYCTGVY
jgi:hypothetical protein